ncbi:MAG TPA: hypothetical protein VHA80_12920 [Solirubrobacterales bacterium]|nr:hypothetical protein [Solirubrobacterales bacterium]
MIDTRPAQRPRRPLTAAAIAFVLCLAAVLVGAARPALAAKAKHGGHPKVAILAPKRDARIFGKTLKVRVRASTTTGLYAAVSGTDVSARFHRHGGLLEARLRRGRDFRLGENTLAVSVGKGRVLPVTVPFVAVSRDAGLLKVKKLTAHGTRPLGIQIRAAARLERLRVTINHHRYPIGAPEGRRRWTVAIGASDGTHFGRNTVDVLAEREGSTRWDEQRIRIHVGRDAPLAGAGPDLTTRTGRAVTLRAGSTKAGSRGGALIYRWQIVEKPAGSHARIADGTSRNARLLPDLQGPYKVRLTAARVSKATAARERAAKATASGAEVAPKPTCLEAALTPLTPAKGSSTPNYEPRGGAGPFLPLNPLESPPCVTPIGEPTPPPLPLEATKAMSNDETLITALPTGSPMGWQIETLANDGSTRIGPQVFPKKSGWVRMLVLGQQTLTPVKPFGSWPTGEKIFQLNEGPALLKAIETAAHERAGESEIFVLTGMGIAQPNPPLSAEEDLAKAISLLGIPKPEPNDRGEIVESGDWSVIGTPHQPGRGFSNLHGLGEQPVEGLPATLPGSLNGWMQSVLTDAFSYVSGEAIPFDTKAAGSSNTVNVIEVGGVQATSTPIVNGALGLHIAVYGIGNASGQPTLAANYTDTIDNPYFDTNFQGVEAAAKQLEQWRVNGDNYLIVMQTVGEEAVGPNTAPWRSKYWVNDALIPANDRGLLEWHNQPYLKAKSEAELTEKQEFRWNPGYPTVAGQVGALTGEVGHDLVAMLGGGNPQVEVSRLTMLAENHPQSVESNYVNGYAEGPGRLAGILVRNARAGLQVENASAIPLPTTNSFRELAFSDSGSGAWPNSTGAENEAALAYFAKALWPTESFKTPREAYVSKANDRWSDLIHSVEKEVKFVPGKGFDEKTFGEVKEDLEREMNDVSSVQKAIGNWKSLLTEKSVQSFVNAERIGAGLVKEVEEAAKLKSKAEAEVDVEGIISESLYVAADMAGFGEDTEFLKIPEIVGVIAGGFGVAEGATPEAPEEAEGPNSNLIRAKGTMLGAAIVTRFNHMKETLGQFEAIFASSWPKLQKAEIEAKGPWSWGHSVEKNLTQSLAVSTERTIYEALLPMAYTQWVIAPYQTKFDPAGPQVPGASYECIHFKSAIDQHLLHPFEHEPTAGLSTAVYRPFAAPGSTEKPAQPYTQPYTIRALKSEADPLEVFKTQWSDTEDLIEVRQSGKNPPEKLNRLFSPINAGETEPSYPQDLGINKVAFYAGYGEGPTEWKRMICAQG